MKTYLSPDNKLYAYEEDGSQDYLIPNNFRFITEEEAQTIREEEELQKYNEYTNSLTYQQKRALEYPSIGDQLDMLWHMMNDETISGKNSTWYNTIKEVKDNNPK